MFDPCHPGEILKEDFVKAYGLTITDFAKRLGVSRKTVSAILNQKGNITPEMSLKISKFFGTDPDFWFKLQNAYDMAQARKKVNLDNIETIYKVS